MKNTLEITLPQAAQWHAADNMASNLRALPQGGCAPVGKAAVVAADAGAECVVLSSGKVLTVAADRLTLALDGAPAGSLGAPFLSLLDEGVADEAIIFTADGPEWFADGACRGSAPADLDVEIACTAAGRTLSASVVAPELTGSYPRMSGELTAADRRAMADAVAAALQACSGEARLEGLIVQPAWVAWRIVDTDGRIIASGAPERVGSLRGGATLHFSATRSGSSGFVISSSAALSLEASRLELRVGRAAAAFWRSRAARIEVAVWPDCMQLTGVVGRFVEQTSQTSSLSLTPLLAEQPRRPSPQLLQSLDGPLQGIATVLAPAEPAEPVAWTAEASARPLVASLAYRSGSLTAYAEAAAPGVLAVASGADPLAVRARARVCPGAIVRVCAPVGSGGGWNYGRHHLLVFSTDGIYSVSIDGKLQSISSAQLMRGGIDRPDAVATAPDAIYVAALSGRLLRLRGSRIEAVDAPFSPVAVGWSSRFGELWLLSSSAGVAATLDSRGRASLRSDLIPVRFIEPSMAVDADGALRSLNVELPAAAEVQWRRRISMPAAPTGVHRRIEWRLDSARADALLLTVEADSGGGSRRLVQLTVNGPVNAPIAARYRSPRLSRLPYATLTLRATLSPHSRLTSLHL